jgi:FkbM family methyltransferase
MTLPLWRRAGRGARTARAALPQALAFARAAEGRAAAALFVAGLAHATPAAWGGRLLRLLGIRRLSLRPRRLGGDRLVIDPTDRGHTCVVEELFVPPVAYDLALVTFEPGAILDCGAHIGVFSLLAHRRFPSATLVAFEPNPANDPYLRENLRSNGVPAEIIAAAVSTMDGRAAFRIEPGRSESGRLVGPSAGDAGEVILIDLPAFVRRLAPKSLCLKMDIEGEEERVLPALLPVLPGTCAIYFETHRGVEGWHAIRTALVEGGFDVRLIKQREVFCDGFAVRL